MIITSKFSNKGLVSDLIIFLLTVLGMMTFASVSGQELVTTIVIAGILLTIAFIIWLFRLKIKDHGDRCELFFEINLSPPISKT